MGKILYFRCVIRGGQSSLFVSLWTVSFWQFNNRFGRRIKAEKATVTMLSFPYSWSRTTHAILLGQKQSFNGFALCRRFITDTFVFQPPSNQLASKLWREFRFHIKNITEATCFCYASLLSQKSYSQSRF